MCVIKVIFVGVIDNCSMCPYVGFPFIPFFFLENYTCFKFHIWSVKREHYTIGKCGLKRRERQNSQTTLMWNYFVFCLWCFPLFSLCGIILLLSFILS